MFETQHMWRLVLYRLLLKTDCSFKVTALYNEFLINIPIVAQRVHAACWNKSDKHFCYLLRNRCLLTYFTSSMHNAQATVTIRIGIITSRVNVFVLKMECKKGTYTMSNCSATVSTMAPHMPRLANMPPVNME